CDRILRRWQVQMRSQVLRTIACLAYLLTEHDYLLPLGHELAHQRNDDFPVRSFANLRTPDEPSRRLLLPAYPVDKSSSSISRYQTLVQRHRTRVVTQQ